MSRISLVLAFCLAFATSLFAGFSQTQDFRPASAEELAMKDVPFAPGASAVILDWVRVDDDVDSFSAEYFRIKVLTAAGADPNAPSGGSGWTPLMHAIHKNQPGTAAALLDGGAITDLGKPDGYTPLMMAAAYDNREMVALLLSRGASPRVRSASGDTALDYAITAVVDVDRFTLFRCNGETAGIENRNRGPFVDRLVIMSFWSSSRFARIP